MFLILQADISQKSLMLHADINQILFNLYCLKRNKKLVSLTISDSTDIMLPVVLLTAKEEMYRFGVSDSIIPTNVSLEIDKHITVKCSSANKILLAPIIQI